MNSANDRIGEPARPSPPRRSIPRTLVAIAAVIGAAVVLAIGLTFWVGRNGGPETGRGSGGPAGGPGGRPAITVGVGKATSGDVPIEISALGTVTPLANINVNARVSGMLEAVTFREGQMVSAGQLLAQVDPRPFQVAMDQAQAQMNHDQALLRDAQLDLARYRTLKSQDSIAGQQLDTQAALVSQYQATIAADEAAIANARLNLSFTHIVSPVSGRVGLRQIDPGNQITANGSTPIVVVTQVSPISVVFALPEGDIQSVIRNPGRGAGLPVKALDRAGGTTLAHGSLATLDNVIDTTTGTVKARARFANPDGALFANQFVNVTMLVDTLHNQVIVPTTAVRHGPQGDFVWVLQPDQSVKVRPVTVGPGTAETVSIGAGLAAGETVITEGGDRLKDGGRVVLPGQRPPFGHGGHGAGHHRAHGSGTPVQG